MFAVREKPCVVTKKDKATKYVSQISKENRKGSPYSKKSLQKKKRKVPRLKIGGKEFSTFKDAQNVIRERIKIIGYADVYENNPDTALDFALFKEVFRRAPNYEDRTQGNQKIKRFVIRANPLHKSSFHVDAVLENGYSVPVSLSSCLTREGWSMRQKRTNLFRSKLRFPDSGRHSTGPCQVQGCKVDEGARFHDRVAEAIEMYKIKFGGLKTPDENWPGFYKMTFGFLRRCPRHTPDPLVAIRDMKDRKRCGMDPKVSLG